MKIFTMKCWLVFLGAVVVGVVAPAAYADIFGSGENAFEIEFVTIGVPGNVADTTGDPSSAGAVPYTYRMGKYEISEAMIDAANAITADEGNPLGIAHDGRGPNKPATRVSWFEAAQFVNWLNTSKGATPAYKFDDQGDFQLWESADVGYDPDNRFRNTQARYFLPSVDEWYKAAFYDPGTESYFDYPTGSDSEPIPVAFGIDPGTAVWNQTIGPSDITLAGGASPFGTVAQAGNVSEWQETPLDGVANDIPVPDVRARRGDEWGQAINGSGMSSFNSGIERLANSGGFTNGFRVASIPEPTSCTLGAIVIILSLACSRMLRC